MSDTEKQVKPKRVMSEEQKAKLAEARKKANEIRAQKKAERLLEKEVNQLEKAEKIETLKQKKEKLTKKPVKEEEPQPEPEPEQEEEEVVYKKKPKPKKKKKIVYYDESSSDEEPEIVYKKRPKGTKTKQEVEEIKNKVESNLDEPQKPQFYQGNFLSDEMIKRQYNAELENARIQEMLKYMKPQNNWQR